MNPNTIERIKDYIHKKNDEGFDLTNSIRSKKIFGNPSILSSVVDHFSIFENGSEYPSDIWNPYQYNDDDYEEEIKERYNSNNDIQQFPTNTATVTNTNTNTNTVTSIATQPADDDNNNNSKKRSRWN